MSVPSRKRLIEQDDEARRFADTYVGNELVDEGHEATGPVRLGLAIEAHAERLEPTFATAWGHGWLLATLATAYPTVAVELRDRIERLAKLDGAEVTI